MTSEGNTLWHRRRRIAAWVAQASGFDEWTTTEFEVRSQGPVEIGVDGEALRMDPPVRFVIRPGAVTIRIPRSAAAGSQDPPVRMTSRETLSALWRTALGRPVALT